MWRALNTLYMRELRHLLRDRHTLIYSVAIPVFLYPAILFCVFQLMAVVRGWTERQVPLVAVAGGEASPLLLRLLEDRDDLDVVPAGELAGRGISAGGGNAGLGDAAAGLRDLVRRGELDGLVEMSGRRGGSLELSVVTSFSSVTSSAALVRRRVGEVLDRYREDLLQGLARRVDAGEGFLDVLEVEEIDVASGARKANAVLALTMPLLMVVIILMGAFYPALDAAAGERERGTLETTLVAPVPRWTIVAGKYLAVLTLALMAFALNFASMSFSFKHLISRMKVDAFTISPLALLVTAAGAVLLAALVSAILMAIAFTARSFREGQSLMAPVYIAAMTPVLLTLSPDARMTASLALTPIVNVTMVFREVLQGRFDWPLIALALSSSVLWAGAAMCVAAWLVSRQGFLLGDRRPALARIAAALGAGRGR